MTLSWEGVYSCDFLKDRVLHRLPVCSRLPPSRQRSLHLSSGTPPQALSLLLIKLIAYIAMLALLSFVNNEHKAAEAQAPSPPSYKATFIHGLAKQLKPARRGAPSHQPTLSASPSVIDLSVLDRPLPVSKKVKKSTTSNGSSRKIPSKPKRCRNRRSFAILPTIVEKKEPKSFGNEPVMAPLNSLPDLVTFSRK